MQHTISKELELFYIILLIFLTLLWSTGWNEWHLLSSYFIVKETRSDRWLSFHQIKKSNLLDDREREYWASSSWIFNQYISYSFDKVTKSFHKCANIIQIHFFILCIYTYVYISLWYNIYLYIKFYSKNHKSNKAQEGFYYCYEK